MNLYLLRHGEAENHAESDANRALTKQGQQDVVKVAEHFSNQVQALSVDRCFASPYLRAQQTAELFVPYISKQLKIETQSCLVPEIRAQQVIQFLESIEAENILLVSHNPLLSELLALLSEGDIHQMKIISTSELNGLTLDHIGLGMATHQFSISPTDEY